MTEPKKKFAIKKENIIYQASSLVFFALGAVLYTCGMRLGSLLGFLADRPHGFLGFFCLWLSDLIPLSLVYLSGFDHFGRIYSLFSLSARTVVCGWTIAGSFELFCSLSPIVIAASLLEILTIVLILSGSLDQESFRNEYVSKKLTPFKCPAMKEFTMRFLRRVFVVLVLCLMRFALRSAL